MADFTNYINIVELIDWNLHFHALQGGRGIGKTYSAYLLVLGIIPNDIYYPGKFLLLRRTHDEAELCASNDPNFNQFLRINALEGTDFAIKKINKKVWGVTATSDKNAPIIGLICGLTTISSVRGAEAFSDVRTIIYDEFVPEQHVRKIKEEASALFGAYDTICRNRELNGEDAAHLIMLSNSNNIYNPYYAEIGVIDEVEKLIRYNNGIGTLKLPERDLEIQLLQSKETFMEKRQQTSIAKLTQGTKYYDMSINNKFSYNDFSLVNHKQIKGMHPLYCIDRIYVWGDDMRRYACYARGDVTDRFTAKHDHDLRLFRTLWFPDFRLFYLQGAFTFETYEIKKLLLDYMDIKEGA